MGIFLGHPAWQFLKSLIFLAVEPKEHLLTRSKTTLPPKIASVSVLVLLALPLGFLHHIEFLIVCKRVLGT